MQMIDMVAHVSSYIWYGRKGSRFARGLELTVLILVAQARAHSHHWPEHAIRSKHSIVATMSLLVWWSFVFGSLLPTIASYALRADRLAAVELFRKLAVLCLPVGKLISRQNDVARQPSIYKVSPHYSQVHRQRICTITWVATWSNACVCIHRTPFFSCLCRL